MEQNLDRAEAIIDSYGCDQSNLIAIMQEIQGAYKYLSEDALTLVAKKLGISTAKVYLSLIHILLSLENVEISNCRWYAMVVNNTELSVDGLTTSGNQWGVNIDQGSRVTLANAEIAEGDSVVFEGQDDSGSLTVESGSLQNIKTQGASTGGTITIA